MTNPATTVKLKMTTMTAIQTQPPHKTAMRTMCTKMPSNSLATSTVFKLRYGTSTV